jgi:hypothetical protein
MQISSHVMLNLWIPTLIIKEWIKDCSHEVPQIFPSEFLLNVLQIIMTNNIFQFGDAFWLQTCGTSIGTSCTCSYATLYWAYIECKYILPKWLPLLPFLWRFIDDKLGIWTSSEEELKLFLQDTNSYSQLNWTSNGLTSSVNFLDLTLTIEENNLPKTHKPSHIHSTRLSTPTECPKKTYLLQPTMILETRHICHRLGNYC